VGRTAGCGDDLLYTEAVELGRDLPVGGEYEEKDPRLEAGSFLIQPEASMKRS